CAYFSIREYVTVVSYEQRQSYHNDFNAEYDRYRKLRAQLHSVTRRFTELGTKLKLFCPGSKECQVKKDKTVKTVSSLSYPF
ncbi:ELL2 factor, partial [Larus smithsonianus]|nr:ELL2 factor [Larus smithsonianus]